MTKSEALQILEDYYSQEKNRIMIRAEFLKAINTNIIGVVKMLEKDLTEQVSASIEQLFSGSI